MTRQSGDLVIKKFEFRDYDIVRGNEIDLIIDKKIPAQPEKGYVPAYAWHIVLHNTEKKVGRLNLRIGDNEGLYYGGNIGYEVFPELRGNHYAAKACRLVEQVALAHDLKRIIITCTPDNIGSIKTIESIGDYEFLKLADLPKDNDMYQRGEKQKLIYQLDLEKKYGGLNKEDRIT
jgi:predicted acetyltransferase